MCGLDRVAHRDLTSIYSRILWVLRQVAPTASTVRLAIYNRNTTLWDIVDFDNTSAANTDFILLFTVSDLTDYKDASNVISCRVYQEIP